jgi:hypothetical protein
LSTNQAASPQVLPAYSQFKKNQHHLEEEINNSCAKEFLPENLEMVKKCCEALLASV